MLRDLSADELKLARHALGLPNDRKRTYRNYYSVHVSLPQHELWDAMVRVGFAKRITTYGQYAVYGMTRKGAEKALLKNESLCPEDFPQKS